MPPLVKPQLRPAMGRRTLFWRHAQAARRHFLFVFERLKAVLRPFRTYRAARFAYHFGADPVFRHDQWLRLRRPRYLFQYRSITSPDRYPAIFELVREGLRDQNEPRMLSFGCASGEEVFTLRDYFPRASVKGIDINPRNIAVCRTRHRERGGDPAILFELNASASNEVACSYDAVFCLAVFQRPKLKEGPEVR